MRRWLSSPTHLFALLLALIPALFLAVFMYTYRIPFPFSDTEANNLLVVLAAARGNLTIADIFQNFHGHYHATSNLTSVLLYYINRWDIYTELTVMYITGLLNTVLLVTLFGAHRENRRYLHLILLPMAALTLSPQQGVNWIATIFLSWHHNLLVTLVVLNFLAYTKPGWWQLAVLIALSAIAPYTVANGLLVWGVGLVGMWLVGYRQWQMYALYLASALASAYLFTLGSDYSVAVEGEETYTTFLLNNPLQLILATLAFMGAGIGFENEVVSVAMGILSLVMLGLNAVYLWQNAAWDRIKFWLLLTLYCLGTGMLVAGARSWDGISTGLEERFLVIALAAWPPTVAVMTVGTMRATQSQGWADLAVRYANIVLFTVFAAGFLFTVYSTTPTLEKGRWTATEVPERRMAKFDATFMPIDADAPPHISVQLAAYEITGHRHFTYPELVRPDALTIVAVDNPYHSAAVGNLLIPDTNMHLMLLPREAQGMADDLFPYVPDPPDDIAYTDEFDPDTWLAQAGRFWAVYHASQDLWRPAEALVLEDYAILDQREADAPYHLLANLYMRTTDQNMLDVRFGDDIVLRGWRIPDALQVSACGSVRLETAWSLADDATGSVPVGVNFVMAAPDGQGIASARGLTNIPASYWQPDTPYGDIRTLEIPCGTPAGDYPLLLGAYDFNAGPSLEARYPNGDPVGGLVYLTNLTVVP